MTARSALVVGGTGPTGPFIVSGLEARGYDVTIMHTGSHELDGQEHFEHIHADVRSGEAIAAAIAGRSFDIAVVTYGRLREIAETLRGRVGHFVSVGGGPAYVGYFDADAWSPAGMPVPTAEHAPLATEDHDGKSYRIARTERYLFEHQPDATHFRYPFVYGPRQLVPREWGIVRRIRDGRRRIILPDGGLSLDSYGYVENLAHALLLAVDQPDAAKGQVFNAADRTQLTLAHVVQLCAAELGAELEIVNLPFDLADAARPLVGRHRSTHRMFDTGKLVHVLGYDDVVAPADAIARTVRWLMDNQPEAGGMEETVLQDPFDYDAEDRVLAAWDSARSAMVDTLEPLRNDAARTQPGYGLAYGGPGSTYVRPDTRI